MLIEILIIVITVMITNLYAYKLIRKIDNKERKRIEKLETEYLEKLKKQGEK